MKAFTTSESLRMVSGSNPGGATFTYRPVLITFDPSGAGVPG